VKWLTHPSEFTVNKLEVLNEARKVGLKTPQTYICSTKSELINFIKEHKRIITKDINKPLFFYNKNLYYNTITKEVTKSIINKLPKNFTPSFFQCLIEKQFEIRVFYLDGNLYSMAIFSQNDSKTSIDFRDYNLQKPNRFVPYIVPENIRSKIVNLMKRLKLTTGSIDLIYDKNSEYIFLEINPIGQFSMVSNPCNYFLEKKVAQHLIKLYEK